MKIKNKKFIVTGAGGGIGSSIVKTILENEGIVGGIDINIDALQQIKMNYDKSLEVYRCDICNMNEINNTIEEFISKYGEIDCLINGAAILQDQPMISVFNGKLQKYSIEDWNNTMRTNLFSVFYLTREVIEKMVMKRTKGLIINITSISAAGNMCQSAYAASKAAMNSLTVTWSQELSVFNLRVAGLAPGMTDTSMPKNAMREDVLKAWLNKTPVKRMGTPAEISAGIKFIIENDFFNGRILELDGGLRM